MAYMTTFGAHDYFDCLHHHYIEARQKLCASLEIPHARLSVSSLVVPATSHVSDAAKLLLGYGSGRE